MKDSTLEHSLITWQIQKIQDYFKLFLFPNTRYKYLSQSFHWNKQNYLNFSHSVQALVSKWHELTEFLWISPWNWILSLSYWGAEGCILLSGTHRQKSWYKISARSNGKLYSLCKCLFLRRLSHRSSPTLFWQLA